MSTSSPKSRQPRSDRLAFRVDADAKALIARAARLERRSVSDFCVANLAEAARKSLAERETLTLSAADHDAFFAVLMNPPEPSERLKRAFAEHAKRVRSA